MWCTFASSQLAWRAPTALTPPTPARSITWAISLNDSRRRGCLLHYWLALCACGEVAIGDGVSAGFQTHIVEPCGHVGLCVWLLMWASSSSLDSTILSNLWTSLSPGVMAMGAGLIRLLIAALRDWSWTTLCLQESLVRLMLILLALILLNFSLLVTLDWDDDIRYAVFGIGEGELRLTLSEGCSLRSSLSPV